MAKNEGYKHVEEVLKSVYLIDDPYIVKAFLAMHITHFLPHDPVWCFLVAPPGGGKTELIKTLTGLGHVHPLSTLTSHSLISGQKASGKETSLLLKIQNGVITIEDFTTLMSENQDERRIIMGQLRAIYGGRYDKTFGTGETVSWEGKVSILAGSTYAIHGFRELYASMGERFLMYNIKQPNRKDVTRRAMGNHAGKEGIEGLRKKAADAVQNFITNFDYPKVMPDINKQLQDSLIDISELATRARSAVERDYRSPGKEIIEAYPPEMPTRFAAQLQTMGIALMLMNHTETDRYELLQEDYMILTKLGLDSVNKMRRACLIIISQYDTIETAGLATKMNFPTATIRRALEDLNALEVIEREKGVGNKGDKWTIKQEYRDTIQRLEGVSKVSGDLTEMSALKEAGEIDDETADINQKALDDFDQMP